MVQSIPSSILNDDVLGNLFLFCDEDTLLGIQTVSKQFNRLISRESLWEDKSKKYSDYKKLTAYSWKQHIVNILRCKKKDVGCVAGSGMGARLLSGTLMAISDGQMLHRCDGKYSACDIFRDGQAKIFNAKLILSSFDGELNVLTISNGPNYNKISLHNYNRYITAVKWLSGNVLSAHYNKIDYWVENTNMFFLKSSVITSHNQAITCLESLRITNRAHHVYSGSEDGVVCVSELRSKSFILISKAQVFDTEITTLCATDQDKKQKILVGSIHDTSIKIFKLEEDQLILHSSILQAHSAGIIEIKSCESKIYSLGRDKVIKCWSWCKDQLVLSKTVEVKFEAISMTPHEYMTTHSYIYKLND